MNDVLNFIRVPLTLAIVLYPVIAAVVKLIRGPKKPKVIPCLIPMEERIAYLEKHRDLEFRRHDWLIGPERRTRRIWCELMLNGEQVATCEEDPFAVSPGGDAKCFNRWMRRDFLKYLDVEIPVMLVGIEYRVNFPKRKYPHHWVPGCEVVICSRYMDEVEEVLKLLGFDLVEVKWEVDRQVYRLELKEDDFVERI